MNNKIINSSDTIENSIAVIGMAGRFPGAKNLFQFWENLKKGRESISHFSDEELKQSGVPEDLIYNPAYVKARGILDDVELFDAEFFGINPYEASITDPQHRFFLEVCWEALEIAGYVSGKYNGSIGVFAGMSDNTYLENFLKENADFLKNHLAYQAHIANSSQFLATKISYYLNLKGPSLNINTACSTSLVAIINACQSLVNNDCDIAIAGGVSIRVPQIKGYLHQEGSIYSSDGKCRTFDKDASGTVGGSGVGAVILKRLSDALRDGDTIDAVIKSYAINNDGNAKAGYAAPSVVEQSNCIAKALKNIDVETITYVETHGTGTLLGDPIEIAALKKAFSHYTEKKNYCAIGSVKTNIGHADSAAGVAGFIKTVLALKNKMIPASLHFNEPNPHIQFSNSPFYVNQQLSEWNKTTSSVRRAGVSSFGIGGTNAHIILEEAPSLPITSPSRAVQIISLSAKTPSALIKQKELLLNYLLSNKIEIHDLADMAYTLHIGRKEFLCRKTFLCSDANQLINLLKNEEKIAGYHFSIETKRNHKKPKIVFLFPGQGTLFPGAAKSIYQNEPVFKKYLDQCASYLSPSIKENTLNYIFDKNSEVNTIPASILQPSLFILEYSLAKTFFEYGIKPDAMLGHSLGEYVAACLSEALSLSDAIRLVSIRGALTDKLKPGAMLAVPMKTGNVIPYISDKKATIAAINAPDSCVVSGPEEIIRSLQQKLDIYLNPSKLKCTLLDIPYAFHSPMVEDILVEYGYQLESINFHPHKIPFLSNLTGTWITDEELNNPSYFVEHFKKTVQFSKALSHLIEDKYHIFLEVGIGRTLNTLIRKHAFHEQPIMISTIPTKKEYLVDETYSSEDWLQVVLSKCWENYLPVIWSSYYSHENRHFIPLPTYPFEKFPHWIDPSTKESTSFLEDKVSVYKPYWEIAHISQTDHFQEEKNYIIFLDKDQTANLLIKSIAFHAKNIIVVTEGDDFKKISINNYQINPGIVQHYHDLFIALEKINQLPDQVLHCWSLAKKETLVLSNEVQIKSFFSLIYFAQAFLNYKNKNQLNITIITNHVKKILRDDYILPEKATLLGIALVLPQEYEQVTCQSIDTDFFTLEDEILVKNIISEIYVDIDKDNLIAYRHGMRLIQQFKENKNEFSENKYYLKKGGTYLITGGLGKIGIKLAEFLANNYSANLILVSRRKSPEHDELSKIRKQAASLVVIQADVTNYHQMKIIFENVKSKHQEIDGIFHLAAIANQSAKILIKDLNATEAYKQFMPKVQGAKIIKQLATEFSIKFCLFYSSISSLLGGIGFASYAASNCCLNSFAEEDDLKTRWGSISWDAWNLDENKMTHSSNDFLSHKKLQPNQAMRLLEQCCNHLKNNSNFIVSTSNLEKRLENKIKKTHFNRLDESNTVCVNVNDILTVKERLKEIFEHCLGIKNLDFSDNFYDAGGDSLSAITLLEMIEESFFIRIKLADFINNNSIDKLAKIINTKFEEKNAPYIIKLTTSETKEIQPIFLIHPVGGTIFCYIELAKHFPPHYSLYGIQDPSIEFHNIHFDSIEKMAMHYLSEIKKIQPNGPYLIGGYSFGTSVAFEIAKQLENAGEPIIAVLLIDGWAAISDDLKDYHIFQSRIERTVQEMDEYIPESINNKRQLISLAWNRMQLLFHYQPSSINTKIILFKAQDILPEYIAIDEATNHWQRYSTYPVDVYKISGDHSSILQKDGAIQIGKVINQFIDYKEKYYV